MSSLTTLESFTKFSNELRDSLATVSDVLGLVLLGSTADTSRVDEWSDHDFFVITENGAAEKYRQDLSWLPDFENIVMQPRETAHGLKVVYENCRVLEFAIFENDELELAAANVFRVTIDRADITARMKAIAEQSKPKAFDFESEFEIFLAHILIGVGRSRRGENLTAGQFARSMCLTSVLGFIRAAVSPIAGSGKQEDNLNRFRRFELQYPELAKELESIQQLPVEQCFQRLLELVIGIMGTNPSSSQISKIKLVKDRLGWT